jgi:hypothetical protein
MLCMKGFLSAKQSSLCAALYVNIIRSKICCTSFTVFHLNMYVRTQLATAVEDCGCKCVWPYDGWCFSVCCPGAQTTGTGSPAAQHVVCEALIYCERTIN